MLRVPSDRTRFGFAVACIVCAFPLTAAAAEYEVRAGYLSASVRDIVEAYDWSLVWAADEDRIVDHPFEIGNGTLREALTDLLAVYRGQFVADLYEANRVVVIDAAPPRVRVLLPGEQVPDAVSQATPLSASRIAEARDIPLEALAAAEATQPPPPPADSAADVNSAVVTVSPVGADG